jgi:hypothetical protein
MLSLGLGTASAFGGTGADQIAFHIGKPAENGNHQAPGAGAGVGPRLRERAELRALASTICLTMPNRSNVLRARQSILVTVTHVAGAQLPEHPVKLAPVVVRARHLLAVILVQPAPRSCSSCASSVCPLVLTRV